MGKENFRINVIAFFVLILFAFLGYRLVSLQLLNRDMWQALAQGQQTYFTQDQGARGEIYLRGKDKLVPAAVNKPSNFCFASPQKVDNKEEAAESLSGILNLEKKEIEEKLENLKEAKRNIHRYIRESSSVEKLLHARRFLERHEKKIEKQQQRLFQKKKEVATKQKNMINKQKKRKVLDKLKEKKYKSFYKEKIKDQQKELDEIAQHEGEER